MIPYDGFDYFLFLLYPLALLLILGLLGWLGPRAVLVVGLGIVLFQYANPLAEPGAAAASLHQLLALGAYVAASLVVVVGFSLIRRRGRSRRAFYGALALALLPLIGLRLAPLASAGHPAPAGPDALLDAVGFLGISYMTFRVIDAIIVVEDGLVKAVNPFDLLSYLTFAPTTSAGPIDRYRRFVDDLWKVPRARAEYLCDVETGIHRIAQGFLYKFIVAVLIARYALDPAGKTPGLLGTAEYTYAYSFYLFFDFAGYSAFAIGVGRFFGIHVPENFDRPFLSRDFAEVWNRWHISLSWWLRDHVYMRFVLKAGKRKWLGGNRQVQSYAGLMLTMGLMGAWHGLVPHYLVYGVYQGGMLVVSDLVRRWNRQRQLVPDGRLSHLASVFATFNLFCFGLLIFSGHLFQ